MRALAASTLSGALLLCASGCEMNTEPPPLREVEVEVDETGVSLSTTTVIDPAELDGVEHVRGHLVIAANGPIRLPDLLVIDGDLRVVGLETRPTAANVNLPKLARVGGNVTVGWTKGAAQLLAPKLASIGGHLDLYEGDFGLVLPLLEEVNGDLRIAEGALSAFELPSLRRVGGALRLTHVGPARGVTITLVALEEVGGDLAVSAGSADLDAPRCLTIGGDLALDRATAALRFAGLREVRGDVRVEDSELTAFDLGSLRVVGDDVVFDRVRGALLSVFELNALTAIGGDLRIARVAGLTVVTLSQVSEIGGDLDLWGMPALRQLNGNQLTAIGGSLIMKDGADLLASLDQLLTLGGDLVIANNGKLTGSFQQLASIGGSVHLSDTLMSYTGLQAVATIGGDLTLVGLVGSSQFDELRFDVLRTIGGSFELRRTLSIEKLTAGNLLSIGNSGLSNGDFSVRANADLVSFGFNALGAVAGLISVRDNPLLPAQNVLDALDDVESGGVPVICGNLGGDPCP